MKKGIVLGIVVIAVGILAYVAFQYSKEPQPGSLKAISDFAIKDTASINQIRITNTEADTTILRRNGNHWTANNEFRIEQSPLNTMLKTIRNIRVKSEVNKTLSDNLIQQMISRHTKVEIYQDGSLSKIYYVGNPTKDQYGTYMLLETPEEGRSSKVFVMELPGHKGHLATRFFADLETWRFSGIFNYSMDNLAQIELLNHEKPQESVLIQVQNESNFLLTTPDGQPIDNFNVGKVGNYVPKYKKIHYNFFENNLTAQQKDSVIHQAQPFFTIKVTDKSGTTKKVDCYKRQAYKGATDVDGQPLKYDIDRFIGVIDNEQVVVCQYFVFDPLFRTKSYFTDQEVKPNMQ